MGEVGEGMKTFGVKEEGHHYLSRVGAYLLAIEEDKIALVKTSKGLFLLGGASIDEENDRKTISRECLEEIGYEIEVDYLLGQAESYMKHPEIGYFHPIQTYYVGSLKKQVQKSLEKDHQLVMVELEKARGQLYLESQNWAIETYLAQQSRLAKQLAFIKEIDQEKLIQRQTLLSDGITLENDAEHAWHMAIMTLILSEYANEKIDVLKTIGMLLIHDLVEIKSGDTYAYDEVNQLTQAKREQEAANYIYSLLPSDQASQLRLLWEEFEEGKSAEAKFARAMDRIQPMMLNDLTEGKMWMKNNVRLSQIMKRNAQVSKGSEFLWHYAYRKLIEVNVKKGHIINDLEKEGNTNE